jgi:hypothetical protein
VNFPFAAGHRPIAISFRGRHLEFYVGFLDRSGLIRGLYCAKPDGFGRVILWMLRLVGRGGSGFLAIRHATANFIRDPRPVLGLSRRLSSLSSTFCASRVSSTRTAHG